MTAGILLAWLFAFAALGCGLVGGVSSVMNEEMELGVSTWFIAGGLSALLAVFLMLDQVLGQIFLAQEQREEN